MKVEDINITADYHTHTVYSHGKGSVRDNVERAIALNLKTIAITDHGAHHFIFGVSPKNLVKQIEEIESLRAEYPCINILSGIESNLKGMSGKIDISTELISRLDVLLCGFHKPVWADKFSDYYKLYYNAYSHYLYKPTKAQIARNTKAYINLIVKNPIDIVTHPNYHLKVDIGELTKVCEDYGTVFELSTRHDDLTGGELEILSKSKCMIAINSDAHKVENIANCGKAKEIIVKYDVALDRIINCNTSGVFVFRSKR